MANIEPVQKSNIKSLNDSEFTELFSNIFEVCGELPQFKKLKSSVNILEERKTKIADRVEKQKKLLDQSFEMLKDVSRKVQILEDENRREETKLLSALGSN